MKVNKYFSTRMISPKFVVLVGLVFFCFLPFAGTLEIHHVFAEMDHDGHEHSDFDLCQWMQQHANGLCVFEKPLSDVFPLEIVQAKIEQDAIIVSFLGLSCQSPRPPPFS